MKTFEELLEQVKALREENDILRGTIANILAHHELCIKRRNDFYNRTPNPNPNEAQYMDSMEDASYASAIIAKAGLMRANDVRGN